MELQPGHIYGLLGRNGVGKSSLLHHLFGLLFPDQGSCQVMGQVPGRRSPAFLQQVFLLPEEIYIPDIPVKQYLRTQAPFYPTFDASLFYAYLEEFHVPVENTLQGMSYGQKKKVMISFALATQANVYVQLLHLWVYHRSPMVSHLVPVAGKTSVGFPPNKIFRQWTSTIHKPFTCKLLITYAIRSNYSDGKPTIKYLIL